MIFQKRYFRKFYNILILILIFSTTIIISPAKAETSSVTVTSVSGISGSYQVGDTVVITVSFSDLVRIKGGKLTLTLETGPTDRTVRINEYIGAGEFEGDTVTFDYVIRHGDRSLDLNYKSINSLLLTPLGWPSLEFPFGLPGTDEAYVRDVDGNYVSLTLPEPLDPVNSLAGSSAILIDGAGGEAEQFQNAHESVAGLHTLSLIEDLRDNTSWLRGWTGSGADWGTIKTPYCENVTDVNCDTEAVSFRAVLPKCETLSQKNCIEGVFIKSTIGGAEVGGTHSQYFPNPTNQTIAGRSGADESKKGKNFTGSNVRNIPSGTTSSIYTFEGFNHAGGLNKYAVTVRVGGWNEPGDIEINRTLFASINPVTFDSTIPCDEDNHGRCWDDVDQYPGIDQDLSKRCIMFQVVDGNSDGHINFNKNDDDANSSNDDITTCALKHAFPENISFRLKVRLSSEPVGWLHGRLTNPDVTFETSGGTTIVEMQGSPVEVPAVSAHSPYEDLSIELKNWYNENCGVGGSYFCGSRFSDQSENWSVPAIRNAMSQPDPYKVGSFEILDLWRDFIGDSASATVSHWNIRTLSSSEVSDAPACITNGQGVTGIVTTNSTLYSEGPPTFNVATKTLNYTISSPHFLNDGETIFYGDYNLLVKPSVANCLFSISGSNVSQSVKVKDENGNLKSGINVSISKNDDWFKFSASNITFSSPVIEASIVENTNTSSGSSTLTSPKSNIFASGSQFVLPNPLKVKDSFFKSLVPSQVGSISVSQFAKLPEKTIALLSPSQATALTSDQLKALKPSQISVLKPSVIGVLNSSQITALQPADFRLLKPTQIAKISAEAASGLVKSDLNAFNQTQLRSLTTNAVKNLKPEVLKSLSVNKLRQFSSRQISSLTDEQKSVLTKTQKSALRIK